MDDEAQFMRRAIEIAERGRHQVMPNPLVGCVLVKDGKIIAEGWHDHIGGLHAEQMAICLLYTSPSPRDRSLSRMPSSA